MMGHLIRFHRIIIHIAPRRVSCRGNLFHQAIDSAFDTKLTFPVACLRRAPRWK